MRFDHNQTDAMLIPDKTECEFQVKEAEEKQSSKGNDMIVLTLTVWDADGNEHTVWDYVLAGSTARIQSLCEMAGVSFEGDNLPAEQLVGLSGRCIVGVSKDKTGQYPDKNSIRRYLTKVEAAPQPTKTAKPEPTAQDMMKKAGAAFKVKTAGMKPDAQKAEWLEVVKRFSGGKPQSQLTLAEWIKITDGINNEYNPTGAASPAGIPDDDIPF